MRSWYFVSAVLLVQALCAFFFVSDIILGILGIYVPPLAWQQREYLEIGAAIGLVLGVFLGGVAIYRTTRDHRIAEEKLRRASGAFMDLLEERFADWGLTAAERDVALFAIKGLSTAEIGVLRNTSEGTVKAQTNAIYRKAGVSGRSQLLSLFIDDLMRDDIAPAAPRSAA